MNIVSSLLEAKGWVLMLRYNFLLGCQGDSDA